MPVNKPESRPEIASPSMTQSDITREQGEKANSRLVEQVQRIQPADPDAVLTPSTIAPIDDHSYRSKAFNSRVRFLVMHYTAGNFTQSVATLTNGQVSAHYLVPDPTDISYQQAGYTEMRIFNLVDEKERAWHAGVSTWAGRSNLNDSSLGIEIVNQAKDTGNGEIDFPPFNAEQITQVHALAADILKRYPDISPVNVVGHADIAPGRKSDPGPAFPWKALSLAGVGAWYDQDVMERY